MSTTLIAWSCEQLGQNEIGEYGIDSHLVTTLYFLLLFVRLSIWTKLLLFIQESVEKGQVCVKVFTYQVLQGL